MTSVGTALSGVVAPETVAEPVPYYGTADEPSVLPPLTFDEIITDLDDVPRSTEALFDESVEDL